MSQLKAGVIGAGAFGRHHARKYAEDSRVQFIGVYDPDVARARETAGAHGASGFDTLDALLSEIDIVTIAAPGSVHYAAGRAALSAGNHVLVEKPIASALSEADEMIALAQARGLVLACGHQERLVFDAMGLFAAGEAPVRIESVREGPWTGRGADVSVTLDLMVHDLDLAARLIGTDLELVSATGVAEHGPTADTVEADLKFRCGAQAMFRAGRAAAERKRTMRLVYPKGEVRVDFLARSFENTTDFALDPNFADSPAGKDPLGANVGRFIEAALGAAPRPAVTGREARDVLALALMVDAATGLKSVA